MLPRVVPRTLFMLQIDPERVQVIPPENDTDPEPVVSDKVTVSPSTVVPPALDTVTAHVDDKPIVSGFGEHTTEEELAPACTITLICPELAACVSLERGVGVYALVIV